MGKATILEVKHAIKPRKLDDKQDEELAKKMLALKENEKQKAQLQEQVDVAKVNYSIIDTYIST